MIRNVNETMSTQTRGVVEGRRSPLCYVLLTTLSAALACVDQTSDSTAPEEGPQDVILAVSYVGTANPDPLEEYEVKVHLIDRQTREGGIHSFRTRLDRLRSGREFTISRRKPGLYYVEAQLDWTKDGSWDEFEPSSEPAELNIDRSKPAHMSIVLHDRTSPNDRGWLVGTATYQGLGASGTHQLYFVVQRPADFSTVVQVRAPSLFGSGISFGTNDVFFTTEKRVPAGTYRVVAYWDVNGNGAYDRSEPVGDRVPVFVSPGLPSVGVDIALR